VEFGEITYRNGKKASLERQVSRRVFHGKGCLFYLYSFTILWDSTEDLTGARTCEVGAEVAKQGFYNLVTGSSTDNVSDNNDACTRL